METFVECHHIFCLCVVLQLWENKEITFKDAFDQLTHLEGAWVESGLPNLFVKQLNGKHGRTLLVDSVVKDW